MGELTRIFLVTIALTLFFSCSKDDNLIPRDIEIQDFVWKGMNAYYLWQGSKPDLADAQFSSQSELNDYLNGYSSPEEVFGSLLFQPGVIDRFSWIVDDYIALENSFQGINLTTGMDFRLNRYKNNSSNVYGYIRYIIPNSSAAEKSLERGMIFNTINGTQLTDSNYQSLLFNSESNLNVGFADFNNGNPTSNGKTIIVSKQQVAENPIANSKVFTEGTHKIGYVLYNQFSSSYDTKLNSVFKLFNTQNINELIVDLRYNSGGSVRTATYLGSMITGQFTGQLYSKEVWNNKVQGASSNERFFNYFTDEIKKEDQNENIVVQEPINSLHLPKVYFIISGSTASASELVINSLRPYIDVKIIGTTTEGKQVGSVTLYDSDNLTKNGTNLNPNHTYAIQPIVLEISNKNNQNEPNGFIPGVTLPGIEIEETPENLGVLGERSDPVLDRTIQYITTGSKGISKNVPLKFSEIYNSKLGTPAGNSMYSELKK
ncbi:MAG: S41 family peptidase [Polaribacter sp.]|nr:S41 family peptidase [Polaribacter sp.]